MKTFSIFLLTATIALFGFPLYLCGQSNSFTYQGRIQVDGSYFTGTGSLKLALVDAGTDTSIAATAMATVTGGFLTSITVVEAGFGYEQAPTVTILDSTGSGATATASVVNGSVSSIVVQNAGGGYSLTPTVEIAPPPSNDVFVSYWSNDGASVEGSEPGFSVPVVVDEGLFSIAVGDDSLINMNFIPPEVFENEGLHLRLWFDDGANGFALLTPDQPITPTPFAIRSLSSGIDPGTVDSLAVEDGSIRSEDIDSSFGIWEKSDSTLYYDSGKVFIGRDSAITPDEYFGVTAPTVNGRYGGMYIDTEDEFGRPFYGYSLSGSPAAWTYLHGTTSSWRVNNNHADRLTVTSNGNVGIGTTDPQVKLQVNGEIAATSFSGSGAQLADVDADTLDGLDSSSFWRGSRVVQSTQNNALAAGASQTAFAHSFPADQLFVWRAVPTTTMVD